VTVRAPWWAVRNLDRYERPGRPAPGGNVCWVKPEHCGEPLTGGRFICRICDVTWYGGARPLALSNGIRTPS
jgi:hypothetical protein